MILGELRDSPVRSTLLLSSVCYMEETEAQRVSGLHQGHPACKQQSEGEDHGLSFSIVRGLASPCGLGQ